MYLSAYYMYIKYGIFLCIRVKTVSTEIINCNRVMLKTKHLMKTNEKIEKKICKRFFFTIFSSEF